MEIITQNIKICTYLFECIIVVYKSLKNAHKIQYMDKFKIEKPEMVNKTFRLPLDLVEQMQTIAQNKNVSLNNLVVQCCEYALKNLEQ